MLNESEVEELQSEIADPVNNGVSAVRTQESSSIQTLSSTSKSPVENKKILPLPVKKATGPRTLTGKQCSSRNSIKHGIFSSSLLLGEENPNLYRSLLKELTESLDPQSMLESLLVEKLATTIWRYRRLLLAESAAIQKNIDDVSTERVEREDAAFDSYVAMEDCLAQTDREGLLAKIAEPGMLEDCLERLSRLGRLIDKNGPDVSDCVALGRVYGARYKERPGKDLFDVYLVLCPLNN